MAKKSMSTMDFANKMGFKLSQLILPISVSIAAAVCDGLSKVLLIPLLRGVIHMDFSFIKDSPYLKDIMPLLPEILIRSNATIFASLVILVLAISIAFHALEYAAFLLMIKKAMSFSNNMRKNIFSRYLGFGKMYFDRTSFGHLNNMLTTETDCIANGLIRGQRGFQEAARLAVYLVLLLLISVKLTLIVFIIMPFLYYGVQWLASRVKVASRELSNSLNELNKKAFNVLSNIVLVKFYTKEEKERENFANISDTRAMLETKIEMRIKFVELIQALVMLAAFILLITAMALVASTGKHIEISGYLLYIFVLRNSFGSFNSASNLRFIFSAIKGQIEDISDIFNEQDKHLMPDGDLHFHGLRNRIEFKDVHFSYNSGKEALRGVRLTIEKGKVFAIVGATGSGKTTLINLLMRFYDVSAGSILIDDVDIRKFTLKSLRSDMSFVSQDTLLFNDTLRANIAYGLENVNDDEILEALNKARLRDFIQSLPNGLDALIGDKGIQLSGGERQRVSIARALLERSEILILDEATSAMDSSTESLVKEAIDEAMKGRTTIVIAHRLSTIRNSDNLIVLENGVVVEEGKYQELVDKKGRFYEYWKEQRFY